MATAERVRGHQVRAIVQGQPRDRVYADQYVVNIGAAQGDVIAAASPGKQAADRIRPHSAPPNVLPRSVSGFLDRDQEQRQVGRALARGQVVDLHGLDGVGKTALISRAMRTQLRGAFPDGMVYLKVRRETVEDLLQTLFEAFFETAGSVKVSPNDVRRHMSGKRALIVVDDADRFTEDDVEELIQAAPQCAVLIAGREQKVWDGTGILLEGLPRENAAALFARNWGAVAAEDRPTVEAICDALDNVPLAIVKTASTGRQRRLSLEQVLLQVRPPAARREPVGQAFWTVAGRLSGSEQRVLAAMAAPGGETVGLDALAFIAQSPADETKQYVNRLQKMGLAYANSPRYSLDPGFRPYIWHAWVDEGLQARAAEYYLQRAGQLGTLTRHPDEENVLNALRYFFRRKQWRQVIQIVEALDRYLGTARRWGQRREALNRAWHAARQVGDRATEAWAQNQLGAIAAGGGDVAAAKGFFKAALKIRQSLGDQAGATISRWNLQVLRGLAVPAPRQGKPPARPGGISGLTVAVGAAALTFALLLGALLAILLLPRPTPSPPPPPLTTIVPPPPRPTTPTPSRTPTRTPTPSATPTFVTEEPPCECGDGLCNRNYPCYEDGVECLADCCRCGDGICESDYPCSEGEGSCAQDCGSEPPPAPIPLYPGDGEEYTCSDDPVQVYFKWGIVEDESGIAGYTIWLSESVPGSEQEPSYTLFDAGDGNLTSVWLACGRDYCWSVRATDGAGIEGAWPKQECFSVAAAPPPCVDFDDLPAGETYHEYNWITSSGIDIRVMGSGYASVESAYSGQEIFLNDVTLRFYFPYPLAGLSLRYAEESGPYSLEINGGYRSFYYFVDIDGDTLGGVSIDVSGNMVRFTGTIESFVIGGSYLSIDDVCPE